MKRLVTAEEMRTMDRRAVSEAGVSGAALMENAGSAVAREASDILRETEGHRVLVCCGKGNNGGDGFVAARLLLGSEFDVQTAVFSDRPGVKSDAAAMLRALEEQDHPVHFIAELSELITLEPADLIIDALLGTGIAGDVTGLYSDAIRWINASGVPVLSVDLPSGLNADTGTVRGECVRADRTVTFAELKRGLAFYPGKSLAGRTLVRDIGIPESVAESEGVRSFLIEVSDIRSRLPFRPPDGHKGTFGRVFVLAGSTGMTGAALLSSLASLRAGAGLTVLGIPGSLNPIVESAALEVITKPLPETSEGSFSLAAEKRIESLCHEADAAALGPGVSRHPETADLLRRTAIRCPVPIVLDADGLNAFEGRANQLRKRAAATVLTPHPGEMSRLSGLTQAEIKKDPIGVAGRFAAEWNAVLVLKGAPSVVADPTGRAFVNPTGNSGMATAGSGDVLTGLIAGLIAQGLSVLDAALCGVYLHGLTGDLAAGEGNPRSLIAGDLLDRIGPAFSLLESTG